MRLKDLEVGKLYALRENAWYSERPVLVLEAGHWYEDRATWSRNIGVMSRLSSERGVAVARWRDDDTWAPAVVQARQIEGPWDEVSAKREEARRVLAEARRRRHEAQERRVEEVNALVDRYRRVVGPTAPLVRREGDEVWVSPEALAYLLDRLEAAQIEVSNLATRQVSP